MLGGLAQRDDWRRLHLDGPVEERGAAWQDGGGPIETCCEVWDPLVGEAISLSGTPGRDATWESGRRMCWLAPWALGRLWAEVSARALSCNGGTLAGVNDALRPGRHVALLAGAGDGDGGLLRGHVKEDSRVASLSSGLHQHQTDLLACSELGGLARRMAGRSSDNRQTAPRCFQPGWRPYRRTRSSAGRQQLVARACCQPPGPRAEQTSRRYGCQGFSRRSSVLWTGVVHGARDVQEAQAAVRSSTWP